MNKDFPTAGNPFSTRHVRPGAIEYLFPPGHSIEQFVRQLAGSDWTGQIVGPHGSGKSTLLSSLQAALHDAGRRTHLVVLHDGERRMPSESWPPVEPLSKQSVVLVDGYEQLNRISRASLKRACRGAKSGLVVTCHESVGLPVLFRTTSDAQVVGRIVRQLLEGHSMNVGDGELRELLAKHGQDIRELLFALYDHYEQQRSG